jgi:hypothetical protein
MTAIGSGGARQQVRRALHYLDEEPQNPAALLRDALPAAPQGQEYSEG